MTDTHTRGPWTVATPSAGFSAIYGPDGQLVFGLAAGGPEERQSDDVCTANAALIAAAPAMLEALRPLAECEIPEPDTPLPDSDSARYFMTMGEIRAARAAIALATGETK
jgi:hypothetical protein